MENTAMHEQSASAALWYPPQQKGFGPWIERTSARGQCPAPKGSRILWMTCDERRGRRFSAEECNAGDRAWSTFVVAYCVKLEDKLPAEKLEPTADEIEATQKPETPTLDAMEDEAVVNGYYRSAVEISHNFQTSWSEDSPHEFGCPVGNICKVTDCQFGAFTGPLFMFSGKLRHFGRGALVLRSTALVANTDAPLRLVEDETGQMALVVVQHGVVVVNASGRVREVPEGEYTLAEANTMVERLARRSVLEWTL